MTLHELGLAQIFSVFIFSSNKINMKADIRGRNIAMQIREPNLLKNCERRESQGTHAC